MRFDNFLAVKSIILLTGIATLSGLANAAVLEEITVTAQKREQNIQDVGISITAFSGEQLSALGYNSSTDVTQQIPGMSFQSFTPAFAALNLRGISQNNFQDNLEAPVAVYVDDAYIASMNAIRGQLFDMERVEVLRGPQGTLFGRNATGGLVHYITKGADDDELNGYIEGSLGTFNRQSIEGAAGGGLGNTLRVRFAGRYEKADGYVKNQVGVRDQHGADGYALRGNIQWDISDAFVADLTVAYSDDNDVPSGSYIVNGATAVPPPDGFGLGIPVPPAAPAHEDFSDGGSYSRDSINTTLKLSWDVSDNMEFVSITNILNMDKFYTEDADSTKTADTGAFFAFTTVADHEQWSQEIRLSGETDRTRWQVGAYYLDIKDELISTIEGNILQVTGTDELIDGFIDLESTNWSVFGQMEYDLTDQLTLIGGLRWSEDDKDLDVINIAVTGNEMMNCDDPTMAFGCPHSGSPIDGMPYTQFEVNNDNFYANVNPPGMPIMYDTLAAPGIDKIDYGDWAARVQLDYRPDDDSLYFVSWNRGIKGGNWSPNFMVLLEDFKHNEEVLNAFEVGTKLTFAGDTRLNATFFYYDYNDYQQFSLLNAQPQVVNRDATNYGGEIELYMSPASGWDVILGASFIESEVDGAPTPFGEDVTDLKLPNAPDFSLNGLVRYAWPVYGGELAFQVDGNYNSEQFLEGTNNETSRESSYFVGNLSLAYTSADEKWRITGWVKNFTDAEYRLYNLDIGVLHLFIAPGFGFHQSVYAPPVTAGVTGSYRW
ncbi:MAG: TonB-dependent receptor [Gammaproteobacteria bacterium]